MKRIRFLTWVLALTLLLNGCSGADKEGNLLAQASPENSALILYRYDGETVVSRTLYDTGEEQKILDTLNGLEAQLVEEPDWDEWSLPCYGLWIASQEGTDLNVAWSDGLWLNQDGETWQVEADFEALWQQLEGEDEETNLTVLNFPNAGLLAKWDDRFLALSSDEENGIASLPLEMYMTVTDITDGVATVLIDNQSGYEMGYSAYYALEWEEDGDWYTLPATVTSVEFDDVEYLLPDLGTATVICDLNIYGALEAGHYRLVKDGMTAEFWLNEQGCLVEGQDTQDAGISMTVYAGEMDAVRVLLSNQTEEDAGYIWDFSLWRWNGETWISVPYLEPLGICGVRDPLPAGETVELSLNVTDLFGVLENGSYRLSMDAEGWQAEFEINQEM